MGDKVLTCTEEELIAQAVALSLEALVTNETCEAGTESASVVMSSSRPGTMGSEPSSDNPRAQSPYGPPMRYGTSQSNDSALAEQEDSFMGYQREVSQLSAGSPLSATQRSSPDLGIAAEADIDPLSGTVGSSHRIKGDGKASNDSPSSSPEADQNVSINRTANITLDGHEASGRGGPNRKPLGDSYQLPFARLSSLHEGLDAAAKVWIPNKDALELIIGMGISENAAKRALYHTGNENAEHAVSWVFENINLPDLHEHFEPPVMLSMIYPGTSAFEGRDVYLSFDEFAQSREDSFKMTLVVNSDLKMGIGKIAAQVGHAVLGLYHLLESEQDKRTELAEWERNGAKKIVLRGKDALHLMELKRKASTNGLACLVVQDAGRTQVDPGSLTVLGILGKCKHVDAITGHLKLL